MPTYLLFRILQRYPVISRDADPWEVDYFNMRDKFAAKRREVSAVNFLR